MIHTTARPDWHRTVYGPMGSTSGWVPRKPPPAGVRKQVLEAQGNACLYCGNPFGTPVKRPHRSVVRLRLHWDHFVPYAYLQRNPVGNWVAACHVCNHMKRALLITLPYNDEGLSTVLLAREYLLAQWKRKGYRVVDPH